MVLICFFSNSEFESAKNAIENFVYYIVEYTVSNLVL
jgi:hypothetical protein